MSKVTINPIGGKPRQYKANKFHSIHPLPQGGSHVVIRLINKDIEFNCSNTSSELTEAVHALM